MPQAESLMLIAGSQKHHRNLLLFKRFSNSVQPEINYPIYLLDLMKNILILLIFISIVNHLAAQDVLKAVNDLKTEMLNANGYIKEAYIEGTPYEKEDNSIGIFYLKDNKVVKSSTKLNYFLGNFEFMNNGVICVADAITIDSVVVDKKTYVFRNLSSTEKIVFKAVQVLSQQGEFAFYVYKGVEFQPEVKAAGYVDPKPARYVWKDPVYYFAKGEQLIRLNNFKGLIAAFPGKENDIKKFIKENKINDDNPEELRKLLGFLSRM